MRRPVSILLCLFACLIAAACAPNDDSGDQRRHGFYGGVSGGVAHP